MWWNWRVWLSFRRLNLPFGTTYRELGAWVYMGVRQDPLGIVGLELANSKLAPMELEIASNHKVVQADELGHS